MIYTDSGDMYTDLGDDYTDPSDGYIPTLLIGIMTLVMGTQTLAIRTLTLKIVILTLVMHTCISTLGILTLMICKKKKRGDTYLDPCDWWWVNQFVFNCTYISSKFFQKAFKCPPKLCAHLGYVKQNITCSIPQNR